MKLVVLDANSFWTESLFASYARFADVLLLKPREIRSLWRLTGRLTSDPAPVAIHSGAFEQRVSMLPGWMFHHWWLSRRKLARMIRSFVGTERFWLVFNYPQYFSIRSLLPPHSSLYYNTDDYQDHWRGRAQQVVAWERRAVLDADLTICIARQRRDSLAQQYPSRANRIFHVPIGCTPELMEPSAQRSGREPEWLRDIPRPVAGYIGALNWRFDYSFFASVARARPGISFVLGGDIPKRSDGDAEWWAGVKATRKLPNVYFVGRIAHEEVGRTLHLFDALLMVYSNCRFNFNACPAKLWDYMGAAKPIVANATVPEVLLWQDVVHIGATPDAFVEGLDLAVRGGSRSLQERMLAIAEAHTWDRLSEQVHEILEPESSPDLSFDSMTDLKVGARMVVTES